MRKGKRHKVEEGIYKDSIGYATTVKVGRRQKEKRWPLDTDRKVMRSWRADERAKLLKTTDTQVRQSSDPRTITRSIVAYLKRRKGRESYKSDRSHLKAWLPFIGHLRRHEVTREAHAEPATVAWRTAGKSERTIRHRKRVLRELYQALDGADVDHPLKGLKLPKVPDTTPIPVPLRTIQRVAKSLLRGKTKEGYGSDPKKGRAWFLVYATCGQRPAQIARALETDVDLKARIWWVRPAKHGKPVPLPLSDDMVAAWTAFDAAKAWGGFDTSSFAKLLRRHGWPKGVRPYALRHTFAIDLLLEGVDLGDIQGFLGHKHIETTRKFYAPILLARLQKSVGKRRLNLEAVPAGASQSVPAAADQKRQKRPQKASSRKSIRTTKKGVSTRKRP